MSILARTLTQPKAHHFPVKLMGCGFVVSAISTDKQLAWDAIRAGVAEMERIELLISSWRTDTVTHEINENAGIRPVKAPRELIGLIQRSLRVSQLTDGAFDISGTLSRYYWNFDKQEHAPLPEEQIQELKRLMDYRAIQVDASSGTVFLEKKGMKIGFGGIGKGYASYRAMEVMKGMGIRSGLVNASGDLMAWGTPPDRDLWEVYVPDPEDRTQPLLYLNIPQGSVVTSGSHENYSIVNGKRLSHIIDPRTGRPVENLKVVSVLCPNPELADALATGISVLGVEQGLSLVNQLKGVECLLIDNNNQQHFSHHLKQFQA